MHTYALFDFPVDHFISAVTTNIMQGDKTVALKLKF